MSLMSRCQPNTSIEQQPAHIFASPTWKYMELLSDNLSVIVEVNIIALRIFYLAQDEHIELFCWRRKLYVKLKSWLHKKWLAILRFGDSLRTTARALDTKIITNTPKIIATPLPRPSLGPMAMSRVEKSWVAPQFMPAGSDLYRASS